MSRDDEFFTIFLEILNRSEGNVLELNEAYATFLNHVCQMEECEGFFSHLIAEIFETKYGRKALLHTSSIMSEAIKNYGVNT